MSAVPRPVRTTETELEVPSVARALRLLGRFLRLRCPHCGGGPVLARWRVGRPWGVIRDRCPACHFRFERSDDGYFSAAMLLFPLLFYPVSKVLWLTIDVMLRPVTPAELR